MAAIKVKDFVITGADLNDIQNQNGVGETAYDTVIPTDRQTGEYMKGALSPITLPKKDYANSGVWDNSNINFIASQNSHRYFFILLWRIIDASIELLEYKGLPDGLDAYKIEYLLKHNGVCGIINFAGTYYAVPVEYENINSKSDSKGEKGDNNTSSFNYAYKPSTVKILSTCPLSKVFKDKELLVGEEIFLIRNNLHQITTFMSIARILQDLESTLYHIEKNIKTSSPKGILFTNSNNDKNVPDYWEKFINSDNTFGQANIDKDLLNSLMMQFKAPYLPVDLPDKTERLVENYRFLLEMIKEIMGFDTMSMGGKKERVVNSEMEASNSVSCYNLLHSINIRKVDFNELNKALGIDIQVDKREITTPLDQVEQTQNEEVPNE